MSTTMTTRTLLVFLLLAAAAPREAAAQLDPLLFLKRTKPNILVMVETTNRMQRDQNDDYLDNYVYPATALSADDQSLLGIDSSNTSAYYRRRYVGLMHIAPNAASEKFEAERIEIVGDRQGTAYSLFDARTRLNIAKASLREAIYRNTSVARFGLMKTRQSTASFPATGLPNEGPVKVNDIVQKSPVSGDGGGKWKITRPTVAGSTNNGAVTVTSPLTCSSSGVTCVVAADATSSNASVVSTLGLATGASGALVPAGRDSSTQVDAPIDLMLTDLRTEATRLANADTQCRNTVAVLVVGGEQGNTSSGDPSAIALTFRDVGTAKHRVPVYVIAVAPPAGADMTELQQVASESGGKYTLITAAMVDDTPAGEPVPEFVAAVNTAVQHSFTNQADCNTDPTTLLPYGAYSEHQVTSPIIGTVYLKDAKDIHGNPLDDPDTDFDETYITNGSSEIPQRSNVMITSSFTLPGFDGKLRAFRVYRPAKPETGETAPPLGYKFVADGTRLWVACAPGTPTSGTSSTPCLSLSTNDRNIYTVLPTGQMVAFTKDNAADLQPYLLPSARHPYADAADAEALIDFIRAQPIGAIIGSTPALMDSPSLDPPPDAAYPGFKADNANRRSMVWVGANDGMIHGIDARLGIETWAFIPFNLLPKLHTLRSGQPVGDFRYFADSSPKISDVKVDGKWRTYLVVGQGAGGTFYQTFDVTLEYMEKTVLRTDDDAADVLKYFQTASSVPLVWAFPRYSMFDPSLGCNASTTSCIGASAHMVYGELSEDALDVEKTVGETWSDPAVGQIVSTDGPYAVLTGSGFYKKTLQDHYRDEMRAGTTFYILDAFTGEALASRDVGDDSKGESVDNCDAANDCTMLKNALQADPVATGPSDSRFITKAYIGDLDGRLWRFDMTLGDGDVPEINTPVKLYDAGNKHPLFTSMATVNVGTTQQYLFQGTGSEFLPSDAVADQYKLLVVLDAGTTGIKKAEILLEKTDSLGNDEKVTSFPAVAGDIVFFATTAYKPATPCVAPDGNLYAFTFIGGPAYDTTGDGTVSTKGNNPDKTKVRTATGQRASAPFIVDQHLVFAAGGNVELFGDEEDFNNGVGQAGVRILSWREVR
jgi:hypothetical protein